MKITFEKNVKINNSWLYITILFSLCSTSKTELKRKVHNSISSEKQSLKVDLENKFYEFIFLKFPFYKNKIRNKKIFLSKIQFFGNPEKRFYKLINLKIKENRNISENWKYKLIIFKSSFNFQCNN